MKFFRIKPVLILAFLPLMAAFEAAAKDPLCKRTFLPIKANFIAMTAFDAPSPDTFPSETSGAIGTKQFVVAAGPVGIITFDRCGKKDQALDTSLDSFFGILTSSGVDAYDAQVRFDPFSKRWFILATSSNFSLAATTSFIYLAVSDCDVITPCTQWNIVQVPQDQIPPIGNIGEGIPETDLDFVTFGIDQTKVYAGMNLYLNGTSTFDTGAAFVFDKQSLLNGGNGDPIAYRNLTVASNIFAPMAVDNFDTEPPFGYIVGINPANGAELILYKIDNSTNTIAAPIFLSVEPTVPPTPIPYKNLFGPTVTVLGIDSRVLAAHVRNQQLFVVRHIGVDQNGIGNGSADRTGVRWTQIDLSTTTPTVVKEGTLYDAGPLTNDTRSFYFPSTMTNINGTMVIAGSVSSANTFISGFAAHRCTADSLDDTELRDSVQTVAKGVAFYNLSGGPYGTVEPWGIYTATSLDPVDQTTLWTVIPYVPSYCTWGEQVVALQG